MANAKNELLLFVKDRKVIAAVIGEKSILKDGSNAKFSFRQGDNWDTFLELLDFGYDSGYGSQKLFGVLWFEDGSWGDRRQYDGSEWWELYSRPDIPAFLL
jgi:hypothetical protein